MSVQKRWNKAHTKYRWRVVVYAPTSEFDKFGNRIMKHTYVGTYDTQKEAEKAERDYMINLEKCNIELNEDATFKAIMNFYIDYAKNEGHYQIGTIKNYECIHGEHLKFFDDMPVSKITKEVIRCWRKQVVKKLSPYRINDCIKLLKAAFNYAIKEEQICKNPFAKIDKEPLPAKLRKRFSIEQLAELLQVCKEELPEYWCLFVLSCLTGMRVGEYTALTVNDIDFNNSKIIVEKQYTRGELKQRNKTSSSTRFVHPSNITLQVIKWHIKAFNIKSGFLFPDKNGNPVSAKWVSRKFKKLLVFCGYEENFCRVHDLRGQYVDMQHAVGTPTEQIAREVGHIKTSTTSDIYTQILAEVPVEMNRRMDERLLNTLSFKKAIEGISLPQPLPLDDF